MPTTYFRNVPRISLVAKRCETEKSANIDGIFLRVESVMFFNRERMNQKDVKTERECKCGRDVLVC